VSNPAPQPKVVAAPPPKPAAPKTGATASPKPAAGQAAAQPPAAPAKQVPKPRPKQQLSAPVAATGGMPMKQFSRAQQAETEFRKGVAAMQQELGEDAAASYREALQLDAAHDGARQALVALLLDEKRNEEAERLLQERLENRPEHTGFAMLLARLQVERAATGEALITLERSLPHAGTKPDYLAFLAALQQRNNLHAEAVAHYRAALKLQPGNGAWLMGCGISLQALRRTEEAKDAYRQALESKTLSPELKVFIQRKLDGL
jgi:MSHA biogenesis protein MshN